VRVFSFMGCLCKKLEDWEGLYEVSHFFFIKDLIFITGGLVILINDQIGYFVS
jgi:hypothetical protein